MEQGKTRNKIQIHWIKPVILVKTQTHLKIASKQITGKKVNALKMRSPVREFKVEFESHKAKSLDHAQKILAKVDIKKVKEAIYFDNEGNQIPLYANPESNA